MNRTKTLAALTLIALTLMAPSLFADNRRHETTDGWRMGSNNSHRTTVEGVIRDIDRDRNEFVIRLDRSGYELIAERNTRVETASRRRGRESVRQLERGDVIRATGIVTRGRMYVERVTLLRDEDKTRDDDRLLTGIVQNVDRRGNVIWVELYRSNRVVAVDVRRVDRNSRRLFDIDSVRRGDRITVRGDWQRNGRFEAERVDLDRGAQW